jgi:maltooligosyltrehalose synthase
MRACADDADEDIIELESIVTALEHLPSRTGTDREHRGAPRESLVSRRRLRALQRAPAAFRDRRWTPRWTAYNGRPATRTPSTRSNESSTTRPYRLAYWRVAAEEINYRRFFDINDLAGVRVEKGEVFEATHKLILQLVEEGKVTGSADRPPRRLYDPTRLPSASCRTEASAGRPDRVYILVEKILTGDEHAAEEWPVAGTVGYEFLNRVNGLFVASGERGGDDACLPAASSASGSTSRARLREEEADPAGRARERAERARLPARPDLGEEPAVPRLHARQPDRCAAGDDRLLPRLPHLHRRATAAVERRPTASTSTGRSGRRSAATAR